MANNLVSMAVQPLQLEDPVSRFGRVAQVQNMIQQGREHAQRMEHTGLQIDQQRRAAADDENWRGAYQEGMGNPDKTVEAALRRNVNPKTIQEYRKQLDEDVKRKADLKKLDFENGASLTQELFDAHEAVASAPPEQRQQLYDMKTQDLLNRKVIKPEHAKPYDPATFDLERAVVTTQQNAIRAAAAKRAEDAAAAAAKEAEHKQLMAGPQLAVEQEKAAAAAAQKFAREHPEDAQAQAAAMTAEQRVSEAGKKLTRENAAKTTDIKNYEMDKTQGFKGTFADWQNQDANRKKPNSEVGARASLARNDRSYNFNVKELDTVAKPIGESIARLGRLEETLAQNTPQADALIAPELLTVMAGGAGSGLRMNEAEISRIIGGRSKWQSLEASINKWKLDPSAARSITPEQQADIRKLVSAVGVKLKGKQKVLDEAATALVDAEDPIAHRKIVTKARKSLSDIDQGASAPTSGPRITILSVE